MNRFEYTVKDENGIHARPAGLIVREAQKYGSEITIECRGKSASLKKLLSVMGLGIKQGDTVTVSSADGSDISSLLTFFENNI